MTVFPDDPFPFPPIPPASQFSRRAHDSRREAALASLAARQMPMPPAPAYSPLPPTPASPTPATSPPHIRILHPAPTSPDPGGPTPPSRPTLTQREIEVLRAWLLLDSKVLVTRELHIAMGTVNTHLTRIRTKYARVGRHAKTKASLAARAIQDGILSIDEL